ncbi:DUF6247 family protein [Kribbella sp. NPDC059898]|uniref:DUF6247 family protein n=1 Tax=Kribbella sp. NPDC059898 TaxID=3346995 RepID=UPI0036662439
MTLQPERTFTAVRAALPPPNVSAFDAELHTITHTAAVDLTALDDFLASWWRMAVRAAADPADWQLMHEEADQLTAGARTPGPLLAQELARRRNELEI